MKPAPAGAFSTILLEALVVAGAGLALALAVNQVSPRGIVLGRNYFPTNPHPTQAVAPDPTSISTGSPDAEIAAPMVKPTVDARPSNATDSSAKIAADILARGFGIVDSAEVLELHEDPRFAQELIVFVDARDDRHYQDGHIPGAVQLDRFYPERYLPNLIAACLSAERIIVYCTGGDCEDSLFAAGLLQEAGVAADRLAIYPGGISDWRARGLQLELGERHSGNVVRPSPLAESPAPEGTP